MLKKSLLYAALSLLCASSTSICAVDYTSFNSKSVGNNLAELTASGTITPGLANVYSIILGLNNTDANTALNDLHGAQYSSIATEVQADVGGQIASIFHRKPYLACCCSDQWRLWTEPFGNWLKEKNFGEEIGFKSTTEGIAVGIDVNVWRNLTFGAGFAWDKTMLTWHEFRGHGQTQGYYGAAYFDYENDQLYFGGSCIAGQNSYDTTRKIEFSTIDEHALASFHALDVMTQLSFAYFFGTPSALIYPYANADYLYLHTDAIHERNATNLNLTVHPNTGQTLRTEAGLAFQVQDTNYHRTICVSPTVALGWVMECPIGRQKYRTTFEGESIPFEIKGWNHAWQLFSLDFGLSVAYKEFLTSIRYNAETSAQRHSRYFGQRCNIHLEYRW